MTYMSKTFGFYDFKIFIKLSAITYYINFSDYYNNNKNKKNNNSN